MNPMRHRPVIATYLLILGCIGGFAAQFYYSGLTSEYLLSQSKLAEGSYEVLVSHIFLHSGISHLTWNMAGLFLFGKAFEKKVGSFKTLVTYFSGAMAGAGASLVLIPGGKFVGASAAIFGLAGGAILIDPDESLLKELPVIRIFSPPVIGNLFSVSFVAALHLLPNLFHVFDSSGSVAYSGHVGGFAAGAFLTYIWSPGIAKRNLLVFLVFLGALAGMRIGAGSEIGSISFGLLILLLLGLGFFSKSRA